MAPSRRQRPPLPLSPLPAHPSVPPSGWRDVWCDAARRRRLPKGCPTCGAAGKLLDKALLRGHYFPDSHLDVILPTHLACETIALVDQIHVEDELVYSLDRPRPRRERPRSLLLRGRALWGPPLPANITHQPPTCSLPTRSASSPRPSRRRRRRGRRGVTDLAAIPSSR